MSGRVKRFRLFVRDPETGIEHSSAFIYRSNRDAQARLWREEGAHVVSWDVVPLPTRAPFLNPWGVPVSPKLYGRLPEWVQRRVGRYLVVRT